jgi:hypothetical protein
MWWDLSAIGCIGASLYVRFRWGDQRGGALVGLLGSVLNVWGAYRRRWLERHGEAED